MSHLQINIDNLGGDYPMLAGNLTSICMSILICVIISLMGPQNYDWKTTREIPTVEEDDSHKLAESGECLIQVGVPCQRCSSMFMLRMHVTCNIDCWQNCSRRWHVIIGMQNILGDPLAPLSQLVEIKDSRLTISRPCRRGLC